MVPTKSVFLISLVCVLFGALISGRIGSRRQIITGGLLRSPALPQALCPKAKHLRVCSHRADAREMNSGVGTRRAIQRLWAAGIDCFDLDILITADSVLMVGHPDWLQSQLSRKAPPEAAKQTEKYTRAQLASWGATEELFPRLESIFQVFAALLREGGMVYAAHYVPDLGREPVLLMDFKGAAFNEGPVLGAITAARRARVAKHVMAWVLDGHPRADDIEASVRKTHTNVALLRGYPDEPLGHQGQSPPSSVSIEQLAKANYRAVGPSLKARDGLFSEAKDAHLPIFSWVADDKDTLLRALQMKCDAAISNKPIAMLHVLKIWSDNCQSTFL